MGPINFAFLRGSCFELLINTKDIPFENNHIEKCLAYFASNLIVIYITTKEMISILPLWTFHLYVATFQQHLHVEYIYFSIDFFDRWLLLTRKLLKQGFLLVKLKWSLRNFYGRHHDLVNHYGISVSQMTTDIFRFS